MNRFSFLKHYCISLNVYNNITNLIPIHETLINSCIERVRV